MFAGEKLLADGCQIDPAPYELASGLSVAWGRDNVLDQPQASTCTFSLYDYGLPPTFNRDLFIGQRVTVRSRYAADAAGYVEALPDRFMDDYALDTSPARWMATDATAVSTRAPYWFPPSTGRARYNGAASPSGEFAPGLYAWKVQNLYPGDTWVRTVDATSPRRPGGKSSRFTLTARDDATSLTPFYVTNIGEFDVQVQPRFRYPDEVPVPVSLSIWVQPSAQWNFGVSTRPTFTYGSQELTADQGLITSLKAGWTQFTVQVPPTAGQLVPIPYFNFRFQAAASGIGANLPAVGFFIKLADAAVIPNDPEAPSVGDFQYFDGSFTDTTDRLYAWSGEAFKSWSSDLPRGGDDPPPLGGPQAPPSVKITTTSAAGRVVLPPADPARPDDWELVPRTSRGSAEWVWSAAVWAAVGQTVTVRLVEFTAAGGSPMDLDGQARTVQGNGQFVAVTGSYAPAADGHWLGLAVEVPTGTAYLDDVSLRAPASSLTGDVVVFDGRVTDLDAEYVPEATDLDGHVVDGHMAVKVTCVDLLADHENRRVGDEPWPQQTIAQRVTRLQQLADTDLPFRVATDVAAIPVTRRDVDAQPVATLLRELATSADAVLIQRTPASGPELAIVSAADRKPMLVLTRLGVVPRTDDVSPRSGTLSACLFDIAANWAASVDDTVTRVDVQWKDQATTPDPTDRTATVEDVMATAALGTRSVSVSTQLASGSDAQNLARSIAARTQTAGTDWRMTGLSLAADDLDPEDTDSLLVVRALLGSATRFGFAVTITDVGGWSLTGPTPGVYVEGGTYVFEDGAWTVSLNVSQYVGQGGLFVYDDAPADWTYDSMTPALTFDGLSGVGPA